MENPNENGVLKLGLFCVFFGSINASSVIGIVVTLVLFVLLNLIEYWDESQQKKAVETRIKDANAREEAEAADRE
jgi:hypothetical protein